MAVDLDGEHLGAGLGQGQRQGAEAGADLDDVGARPDVGDAGDAPDDARLGDEVLPEGARRGDPVAVEEREDDVPARLFSPVHGGQVEIGPLVVRVDDRIAVGVPAEKEELRLRPGHHDVPERRGAVHLSLQRLARTAGERRAVRVVDVADESGDLVASVVRPGIDRERAEIRDEVHVRLLDPREPLDRRAVELDLAVERLLEL